jgi:NAD(P)-dependent dehydrogenase (short-subunit alcohol dehydrogenase family)
VTKLCEGRVAVITGAGRGIGREHALLLAEHGAKVVVNDLGGAADGAGEDRTAAEQVVDEITAMGGEAVANADDVADWDGGADLIASAIDAFGRLDILVNNAGILRDRVLVNMTEQEWDSVIHVHLKGHFVPTRHAAAYWREQAKAGKEVKANVVNTSSTRSWPPAGRPWRTPTACPTGTGRSASSTLPSTASAVSTSW